MKKRKQGPQPEYMIELQSRVSQAEQLEKNGNRTGAIKAYREIIVACYTKYNEFAPGISEIQNYCGGRLSHLAQTAIKEDLVESKVIYRTEQGHLVPNREGFFDRLREDNLEGIMKKKGWAGDQLYFEKLVAENMASNYIKYPATSFADETFRKEHADDYMRFFFKIFQTNMKARRRVESLRKFLLSKMKPTRPPIDPAIREEVYERNRFELDDGRSVHVCVYCGVDDIDAELHMDHITPYSLKGPDTLENLVLACKDCNMAKFDELVKVNGFVIKDYDHLVDYIESTKPKATLPKAYNSDKFAPGKREGGTGFGMALKVGFKCENNICGRSPLKDGAILYSCTHGLLPKRLVLCDDCSVE